MIQKKICMVGPASVGKTSLVSRFIYTLFSDKYLSTVGVKIDKKTVAVAGQEVTLMLWDLAGDDEFQRLKMSYLRGASGYLLVADGTRRATLDHATRIAGEVAGAFGPMPRVLVLNKCDLADEWEIEPERFATLAANGWIVMRTSAKTGAGVEEAFTELTQAILSKDRGNSAREALP